MEIPEQMSDQDIPKEELLRRRMDTLAREAGDMLVVVDHGAHKTVGIPPFVVSSEDLENMGESDFSDFMMVMKLKKQRSATMKTTCRIAHEKLGAIGTDLKSARRESSSAIFKQAMVKAMGHIADAMAVLDGVQKDI